MTIIKNGEDFRIIDLLNQYDNLYFEGLNVSAHPYCSSLVVIDLSDAMKPGKSCTRWLFSASPWKMDADRLCMTEYVEMAAPECDTLAELVAWLRASKPLQEVDGLTVETEAQSSSRTFSPFAPVKPVKLGERLNASTIAKAIRAGQIVAGRTEGRYTDDYAADAAYDFYRGEIDLQAFAQDIYEHPSGWRFWWHDESRKEITAACHTFDYKRLAVAV
jgi:hypothetical protein